MQTGTVFGNTLKVTQTLDVFQDKDTKISFLQKAIDVVVMVSGEPLLVKPARIVAGHEPERTNELLQRIGRCCLSKVPRRRAPTPPRSGDSGEVWVACGTLCCKSDPSCSLSALRGVT